MIYIGDNPKRDRTIRLCISTINKVKGTDIGFHFSDININKSYMKVFIFKDRDIFGHTFGGEDLAEIIGEETNQKIDFGNITDQQYVKLCEYIIKELGNFANRIANKKGA